MMNAHDDRDERRRLLDNVDTEVGVAWRLASAMQEGNSPVSAAVVAEVGVRPDGPAIVAAMSSMLVLASFELAERAGVDRDAAGWLRWLALEIMATADRYKDALGRGGLKLGLRRHHAYDGT